MRHILLFVMLIISCAFNATAQSRTITGHIIDKDFFAIPYANILTSDSVGLGIADYDGKFKIMLPSDTSKILISVIGYEWASINLAPNCEHLEIIMVRYGTYDYMSARRVDKLRKREFDKLPAIRIEANNKGVFKSATACYNQNFVSIRKTLLQYKKNRKRFKNG